MAIFQLEIADADVERVFGAICSNYGWPENIPNPEYVVDETDPENPIYPVDEAGDPISATIPNPETQGDFTHRIVRQFLSEHVESYEIDVAKRAAAAAVSASVIITDPDA
tara:strand:- start:44 stop:373 length:330 start_codon:yes stop_codon:yes gene_type:complete